MRTQRTMALLLFIAIVAAACADTDGGETSSDGAPGAPIGACTEEEPDCVDTVTTTGDDESPTVVSGGGSVSGFVVDGGLTVPEAIATDATGILAVQGFIVGDASGWRLCELLAESFPAQCGGAALPLGNFEPATIADLGDAESIGLQESQGVTWTDQIVLVFGEIVDGTLVVDTTVAG